MADNAEQVVKWVEVPGFPQYEISSTGDVRHKGTKRLRKLWEERSGHLTVTLRNPREKGRRLKVHRLVAEGFIPNPDRHPFVRHLNDIPGDNRVENLAWGTNSDNQKDSVRNGTHFGVNKTHCPRGHEYSEGNTSRRGGGGSRLCLTCERSRAREKRKLRNLPPGDHRHGTVNGYSNFACRCEPCKLAGQEQGRKMYLRRKRLTSRA